MGVEKWVLEQKLREGFGEEAVIKVMSTAMDNDHYEIYIKSAKFIGLSRVNAQRLVNTTLGKMVHDIHALSMRLEQ
jgi:stress-induced morphogen